MVCVLFVVGCSWGVVCGVLFFSFVVVLWFCRVVGACGSFGGVWFLLFCLCTANDLLEARMLNARSSSSYILLIRLRTGEDNDEK